MSKKDPVLRVVTRPNDANPNGDIFGGWLMSQADIAGAIEAIKAAQSYVVTRAVKDFQFIKPLFVSDLVSFYAKVEKIGKTSVTVHVDVFAERISQSAEFKVAEALLVYVAVSAPGVKKLIEHHQDLR